MIDHRDDSLNKQKKMQRQIKPFTMFQVLNSEQYTNLSLTDGPVSREVPESAMAEQPLEQYPE